MKFLNKNYYEILDIEPDASEEEVRRAYHLVRSTWNPDSIAVYSLYTPEENDAIAHKIEEAYHILSNAERRASYDRFIREVERIPQNIKTPAEFWDFAHGIAPPDEDEEGLEDVTDLLSDSDTVSGEIEEEVLMEAAGGGEGRGFTRDVPPQPGRPDATADAPQFDGRFGSGGSGSGFEPSVSHVPEVSTGSGRGPDGRARGTQASTESIDLGRDAVLRHGADSVRPARPVERASALRSVASSPGRVPPAPPAPATPPPSGRVATPSKADPTVSARKRKTESVRPQSAGVANSGERASAASRWTRSYARPLRVPPPLPDRPIPPEMMARLLEQHGYSGAFLEAVREFKQIRLEDISDRTKIQKTYLRYIEEERFDALPARVYVEGFVSQYARLLKLDASRVTEGYMDRYDRKTSPAPDGDFHSDES